VPALEGFAKSIAIVVQAPGGKASAPVVVADECTVNAVDHQKSFVLDYAVTADSLQGQANYESAIQLPELVADCVNGFNLCLFAFGPASGGKSRFMLGSAGARLVHGQGQASASSSVADSGLVINFVRYLFAHLDAHEVTHFNIRCSCLEIVQDTVIDLLSDFGGQVTSLGGATTGSFANFGELSAFQAKNAQDVIAMFSGGLQRSVTFARQRSSRIPSQQQGTTRRVSHLCFTLVVENFNSRGHFRRSVVQFVDLAGASPPTAVPEQVWVNKTINALCDAISVLSATKPHGNDADGAGWVNRTPVSQTPLLDMPHRQNRLVQLLREGLGGNARGVMYCCVDPSVNTADECVAAFTYAFFYKSVLQRAVPYDVHPELQRLNMQLGDGDPTNRF